MLSKNVNNKKCAPKLIFFNEKKIEKDSDNFWYRKLTLKVKRLGDFALFDTSPLVQFSKFTNFLFVCWFLGKNLSNFVPPVWKLHTPYCHNQHTPKLSNSQILALFGSSPLIQNTKFNNFFWVSWFLGKNLSNFVPPVWKLHNPYCHTPHTAVSTTTVFGLCTLWQYGLWSFQTGYTKLERFLHKNQHTQRKLLNFENWTNGEPQ